MDLFETLVETLKKNPKKIVFTEGTDARILSATDKLVKSGDFLKPVLVGKVEDVKAAAEKGGFCIDGAQIVDPETYEDMDNMAQTMFDLRKGKMDMDTVKANLKKGNYFGTMLVKDNRTGYETSNINAVMDGDLDGFVTAYLTCAATNTWVTK